MNAISFGTAVRKPQYLGATSGEATLESPLNTAWIVLDAANDLGDHATVEVCRRIIDANLNGTPATLSDLDIILKYFR
jgi:hypothetical protein